MSLNLYNICIKQPTRISQTTSTCLDLIFTNFNDENMYTTVEDGTQPLV